MLPSPRRALILLAAAEAHRHSNPAKGAHFHRLIRTDQSPLERISLAGLGRMIRELSARSSDCRPTRGLGIRRFASGSRDPQIERFLTSPLGLRFILTATSYYETEVGMISYSPDGEYGHEQVKEPELNAEQCIGRDRCLQRPYEPSNDPPDKPFHKCAKKRRRVFG